MRLALASVLLLALVAAAAAADRRSLLADALSPTQKLNQQKQQQMKAESQKKAQEAQARRVQTQRLNAPCFVPSSYYPIAACSLSKSPQVCGRGWNAWASFADCCRPGRGAFVKGCTDLDVERTCYITGSYYPTQACQLSSNSTRCLYNWGQWPTQEECCAPGNGFLTGCSESQPCWVADQNNYPDRRCYPTTNTETCTRGWGTWTSQDECCIEGNGFSDGCTDFVDDTTKAGGSVEAASRGQ